MRVTMATHPRKWILRETLIPSPRSWDSLTFYSHKVIRYQLSVQGGGGGTDGSAAAARLGWVGGWVDGWGGGGLLDGEEGVKDAGTLCNGVAGSGHAPDHLHTPPTPHAPAAARARPSPPPGTPRAPAPRPPAWAKAHLSVLCAGRDRACERAIDRAGSPPLGNTRYVPGAVPSLISVILKAPLPPQVAPLQVPLAQDARRGVARPGLTHS